VGRSERLIKPGRVGPTAGVPVVAKAAPPGSHVGMGEPLSASKWEPHRKMTLHIPLREEVPR